MIEQKKFVGVVEDRNDPLKTGRVRVRVLGAHSEDKNQVPTEHLPWATVVGSPQGFGIVSPPKEGTWVEGYFADGELCQLPVITGIHYGLNTVKDSSKGFSDPGTNLENRPQAVSALSVRNEYNRKRFGLNIPSKASLVAALGLPSIPEPPDIPPITTIVPIPDLQSYLTLDTSSVQSAIGNVQSAAQSAADTAQTAAQSAADQAGERAGVNLGTIPTPPVQAPNVDISSVNPGVNLGSLPTDVSIPTPAAPNIPSLHEIDLPVPSLPTISSPLSTGFSADDKGSSIENETAKPLHETYQVGEPTSSPLGRGAASTIVNNKLANRAFNIEIATRQGNFGLWHEQETAYAPVYPYNKAFESESGHAMEFDDTKDKERVHLYHRSGSFVEFHPDGNQTNRIVNDQQNIVLRNKYDYTGGHSTATYNKSHSILVKDDYLLIGAEDVILSGNRVHLGSRDIGSNEQPLVFGYILLQLIDHMLLWMDTHTHPTSVGPSGPAPASPIPSSIGVGTIKANIGTLNLLRNLLSGSVTTR